MAKRGTIANYTPAKLKKVITDTASKVRDDSKIVFGDNNDAHIEYNEDGDNFLVISGSSSGLVLSGSTIQIAGTLEGASPLKIGGELQFVSTGSAGAFNFGPNQEAKIYYSGEVANDGRIIEDMLVISGSANGGVVISGSHTIIDSSLTIRGNIYSHGDVTVNAQDSVSLDPANNIILNPGAKTISHKDFHILDDKRLYLGSDDDAYIEYDESGDDFLSISGSSKGIVLSGSLIKLDGDTQINYPSNIYLGGEYQYIKPGGFGGIFISSSIGTYFEGREVVFANDVRAEFGSSNETFIKYDNAGDQYLVISGSSKGIALSGSSVVFDGSLKDANNNLTIESSTVNLDGHTLNLGQNDGSDPRVEFLGYNNDGRILWDQSADKFVLYDDTQLNDGEKLFLGSSENSFLEYDSAGDQYLTISGSSKGIVLSGSNIVAKTNNIELGSDNGSTVSLNFKGAGNDGYLFWYPAGNQFIMNNELRISDDQKVSFGNAGDGHIEYNEDGDNHLVISGSTTGLVLSGSKLILDITTVASGSISGPGSYLGVTDDGQVVLTSSLGGTSTPWTENAGGLHYNDGNIGIGTSAPNYELDISSDTVSAVAVRSHNNTGSYDSNINFFRSRGTANAPTAVQAGDELGTIQFYGRRTGGPGGWNAGASIKAYADVASWHYDAPSKLAFSTTEDGGWSPTERMQIRHDGRIELSGSLHLQDNLKFNFGTNDDASITYNEASDNHLVISGSSTGIVLSGSSVSIDGTLEVTRYIQHSDDTNTKIEFTDDNIGFWSGGQKFLQLREGADSSFEFNPYGADLDFVVNNNVTTRPSIFISGSDGKIHSHYGVTIHDDQKLHFGSDNDASITYDDVGNDYLIVSGSSAGLQLAGSKLVLDSEMINSGTLAGPGSYLGITSDGQLILTSSLGGTNQTSSIELVAGNNIALDTDENGIVTISYLPAHASDPIPDDDSEAASIATGGALYWRAGSGYRMSLHNTGYLGVGVTGSENVTHRITLPDTDGPGGQIKANAYVSYSTRRLKKDIEPLQNSLEVVKNLQGVSYKWKDSNREDYGFIAEEVGKTLPGIVQWEENGKDAMSMDYIKIISFLVEAVKEQQTQIEKLNQRLGPDDTEE